MGEPCDWERGDSGGKSLGELWPRDTLSGATGAYGAYGAHVLGGGGRGGRSRRWDLRTGDAGAEPRSLTDGVSGNGDGERDDEGGSTTSPSASFEDPRRVVVA
jgi:hypothetical protein